MVFSSITFLFYFLPIVVLLYFCVPKSMKNPVLFLVSLVFYAWGEPKYLVLMILSIMIGYGSGLMMERFPHKAEFVLVLSLGICVGILFLFKYAGLFKLPVGISFYTFQIISYIIDVYRKKTSAQKNFLYLGVYIAMFPQLVAGPIIRYLDIKEQLEDRTYNIEGFAYGIRRFVFGLGKKVILADSFGQLCEICKNCSDNAVLMYWLCGIAFTLQIYFDFSGYSDMAIGLGGIFGFTFMENFRYPYISKSITEFWRRWHISLGQWFRDYVYIPMGGSRKGKGRWFLNIFVVWLLTGAWHGGAWNFVVWGLYFALLLIIEKQWLLPILEKCKFFSHLYVMFGIVLGFVLFGAADLREALLTYLGMFGLSGYPLASKEFFYYLDSYKIVLILGIIGVTPFAKCAMEKMRSYAILRKIMAFAEPFVLLTVLIISGAYLVDGSFSPFLYFRF